MAAALSFLLVLAQFDAATLLMSQESLMTLARLQRQIVQERAKRQCSSHQYLQCFIKCSIIVYLVLGLVARCNRNRESANRDSADWEFVIALLPNNKEQA